MGEAVGGAVFAMSPVVLGLAVRFQTAYQLRERDQVVLLEREQLARELHDTVAHHVSAIAVRAQAGRVVAATDPGAAVDALLVIEAEASRALTEMRLMVGALRTGEEADARAAARHRRPRAAGPRHGQRPTGHARARR